MHKIDPFGKKISGKDFRVCRKKRWNKTFLGIQQAHTYWLYKVIDDILSENREIKGIIEIGTFLGALSVFLALECYERRFKPLLTFDIKKHGRMPRLFALLKIDFMLQNCFAEESVERIKKYLDVPVFFICDGGHKNQEFNQFAPLVPRGSVIALHDWPFEVWYSVVKETVTKLELIPIKTETWCAPPDYIFTSFWKKV